MDDENSQYANRDFFNIGSIQGDVKVINYDKQPQSREEFKARQRLLAEMRAELAGRKPLHRAAILNLGKEQQPHQVQRPWDNSIKVGEQRSFHLSPETTILEVFDDPTVSGKLLILGKPGSGKTTTLLQLAQALCDRAEIDSEAPIPVILELSSWRSITKRKFPIFWHKKEYDPPIHEWILSELHNKGVNKEIGKQWIRHELVLLLDGLDELSSERQVKCVQAINQFSDSEYSPLHLVVCSRKEEYESYEDILCLNTGIVLEDLTEEQIKYYLTGFNLEELWENVKDFHPIKTLIAQPLFLSIMTTAYLRISIDEWMGCNTQDKCREYLLDVYAVEVLFRKNSLFANREFVYLKFLSRILQESSSSDFYINKIQPKYSKAVLGNILGYINYIKIFVLLSFGYFFLAFLGVEALRSNFKLVADIYTSYWMESSEPQWNSYLNLSATFLFALSLLPVIPGGAYLADLVVEFTRNKIKVLTRKNQSKAAGKALSKIIEIFCLLNILALFMLLSISAISVLLSVEIHLPWLLDVYKSLFGVTFTWAIVSVVFILWFFFMPLILFTGLRESFDKVCSLIAQTDIVFLTFEYIVYNNRNIISSMTQVGDSFFWFSIAFVIPITWVLSYYISSLNLPVILYFLTLILGLMTFMFCVWILGCVVGLLISLVFDMKFSDSQRPRRTFFFTSLVLPNCVVLVTILLFWIMQIQTHSSIEVRFVIALVLTLWLACGGLAYIKYITLRFWLWSNGYIPGNVTAFLDYCTERLILQRVGNRYRFIHRLLQEHFSSLEIQRK